MSLASKNQEDSATKACHTLEAKRAWQNDVPRGSWHSGFLKCSGRITVCSWRPKLERSYCSLQLRTLRTWGPNRMRIPTGRTQTSWKFGEKSNLFASCADFLHRTSNLISSRFCFIADVSKFKKTPHQRGALHVQKSLILIIKYANLWYPPALNLTPSLHKLPNRSRWPLALRLLTNLYHV